MIRLCLGLLVGLCAAVSGHAQFPVLPIRIGGTVTVDGTLLTSTTDTYEFRVENATSGALIATATGLTSNGGYAVDLPGFDAISQPNGVQSGTRIALRVSRNGTLITLQQPTGGLITVGGPGTLTIANLAFSVAGPQNRLVNLAARVDIAPGATVIPGFVIQGTGTKTVLIRAVGPGLATFGLTGLLPQPRLRLVRDGAEIAANTRWSTAANAAAIATTATQVGAFALPANSADSAILTQLIPASYSVLVDGIGGTGGIALIEVYEVDAGSSRLINLATRGTVGTGGQILIPGFVVRGTGTRTFLIRAVGPGLSAFNVGNVLAQPVLAVFSGTNQIAANTRWGTASNSAAIAEAAQRVGAFSLANGSADCALLLTLEPGTYTAQASGLNNTTGEALVEVYELP